MATTTKPRRGTTRRAAALLALAAAAMLAAPAAWAIGELSQKPGTAGCVSENGSGGLCQNGKALENALHIAASRDGTALHAAIGGSTSRDRTSVYLTSAESDAVAVFDRDPTTGALTQKPGTAGCISENGTSGACQDGTALDAPLSVTTSPDGKSA